MDFKVLLKSLLITCGLFAVLYLIDLFWDISSDPMVSVLGFIVLFFLVFSLLEG